MIVPLYGFLRGDALGLIVLVQDSETIATVAQRIQQAAAVRVSPTPHVVTLFKGQILDPLKTIAQAGLSALDRVDVISKEPHL